jgi:hypothetical protein
MNSSSLLKTIGSVLVIGMLSTYGLANTDTKSDTQSQNSSVNQNEKEASSLDNHRAEENERPLGDASMP